MSKIILDLCGGSGAWSKPYKDNGYDVKIITLPEHDVLTYEPPDNVYGILAAPPCESFSNVGRGKKIINQSMDIETGLSIVNACLKIIEKCNPVFWALENPAMGNLKKYIGQPTMKFQPYQFGDGWCKYTAIWGKFNIPEFTHTWETATKYDLYIRKGRKRPSLVFSHKSAAQKIPQFHKYLEHIKTDYDFRSIIPQGFANAFYAANQ